MPDFPPPSAVIGDEESWNYKLLCALTDPSLQNIANASGAGAFTPAETVYILISDVFRAYGLATSYVYPVRAVGLTQPLPVFAVPSTRTLTFHTNARAFYVKKSDIDAISYDARERWHKRLNFLYQNEPATFLIKDNQALNTQAYNDITQSADAIIGFVSADNMRMIVLMRKENGNYKYLGDIHLQLSYGLAAYYPANSLGGIAVYPLPNALKSTCFSIMTYTGGSAGGMVMHIHTKPSWW